VGIFGVHLLHLGRREPVLRRAMQTIEQGIEDGRLRPVVDRVFPLSQEGAIEAHAYVHQRRNLGKVILAR
jgi:NADPH:quinone reductase-like Zn-dependent oxidoreductase